MLRWAAAWAGLFGLYLLFAGQASPEELVAAALSAAAAAGSGLLQHRFGGSRAFRFRAQWLSRMFSPVVALATDTFLVGGVLLCAVAGRPQTGAVLRQPFDDRRDTPLNAARRAMVVLAASVAPNTVALGVAPKRLLLHRLSPRPPSSDRQWPL